MKVKTIMTREVTSCSPGTTLGRAARTMREIDSGVLPVVRNGEAVGMITDRDICLALAERDLRASEITVGEVVSRGVHACSEQDSVHAALATMKAKRVRRLPVLDAKGVPRGLLSMNDVILHAEETGDGKAVSYGDTVRTLQAICEHRYPAKPAIPADVTELARGV